MIVTEAGFFSGGAQLVTEKGQFLLVTEKGQFLFFRSGHWCSHAH